MNKTIFQWKKPEDPFNYPYYECWLWKFPYPYSNILVPVWWSKKKRNVLLYNLNKDYKKYNSLYSIDSWKKRIDGNIFILGYSTDI